MVLITNLDNFTFIYCSAHRLLSTFFCNIYLLLEMYKNLLKNRNKKRKITKTKSFSLYSVEASLAHNSSDSEECEKVQDDDQHQLIQIVLVHDIGACAEREAFEHGDSVRIASDIRPWAALYLLNRRPEVDEDILISIEEERNVLEQRDGGHVHVSAGHQQQNQIENRRKLRPDEVRLEQPGEKESVSHRTHTRHRDGQRDAQVSTKVTTDICREVDNPSVHKRLEQHPRNLKRSFA